MLLSQECTTKTLTDDPSELTKLRNLARDLHEEVAAVVAVDTAEALASEEVEADTVTVRTVLIREEEVAAAVAETPTEEVTETLVVAPTDLEMTEIPAETPVGIPAETPTSLVTLEEILDVTLDVKETLVATLEERNETTKSAFLFLCRL